MEEEKWLPVVGYEGLYEVSDFGRVRSLDRVVIRSNHRPHHVRSRITRLTPTRQGYLVASLCRDGEKIGRGVHRLVLTAFLGLPELDSMEVNHKDFDKSNNRLSNLEWVTHVENIAHACANGRARPILGLKKSSKYVPEVAFEVRRLRDEGRSPVEISEMTRVPKLTVWNILSNRSWAAPGAIHSPRRGSAAVHASKAIKLTLDGVREIRAMCLAGARQKDVAAIFDVNPCTISAIVRNKMWQE